MTITVSPWTARGTLTAPPSKSMAHRLLLCAGFAEGKSRVSHLARSADIDATVGALRALGAEVAAEGTDWTVRGRNPRRAGEALIPCGDCGTTMRLTLPPGLLSGAEKRWTGSAQLMRRPMEVYARAFSGRGILWRQDARGITAAGPLPPGAYEIPGNISSQFASGLLMALPLADGDSELRLTGAVESAGYLRMTLDAMALSGVTVAEKEPGCFQIPGGQRYLPIDGEAEGDWSNAAFLLALNALGGKVAVTGLREDSRQGDRAAVAHLAALAGGYAEIDLADCPDLGPVLFAVAGLLHGAEFTHTARLRLKESDRIAAMAEELGKAGIRVEQGENRVRVFGGGAHRPEVPLQGHEDHRIAMALGVVMSRTGGTLEGAACVAKSWPGYWQALTALGMKAECDCQAEVK